MTAASDAMAERLRPVLEKTQLEVVEKKMFGGVGFMLNGNMLIGTTAKGALLVRVDPQNVEEAQGSRRRTDAYGVAGDDRLHGRTARGIARRGEPQELDRILPRLCEDAARQMKTPLKSSSTMDHLADRVRGLVGLDPRITEKTMFGGLTFLLNGHILVACKNDGRILLSVGKANNDEALRAAGNRADGSWRARHEGLRLGRCATPSKMTTRWRTGCARPSAGCRRCRSKRKSLDRRKHQRGVDAAEAERV